MSVLFIDSVQTYTTNELINNSVANKWGIVGGINDKTIFVGNAPTQSPKLNGRVGSNLLIFLNVNQLPFGNALSTTLPVQFNTTTTMGFRYIFDQYPPSNSPYIDFIGFGNISPNYLNVILAIDGFGNLHALDGKGNLLCTCTVPLYPLALNYIEVSIVYSSTVGTISFRINEEPSGSFSNLNTNIQTGTGTTGCSTVILGFLEMANAGYQDIYISNDSAFLGDVRADALWPTGPGAYTQLTPTTPTGVNWSNVNNITPSTTIYNTGLAGSALKDLYTFSQLNIPATSSIYAVQQNTICMKSDTGSSTIQPIIYNGGTLSNINGLLHPTTTQYANQLSISTVNPISSAPWTVTEINNTQYGIEIV